MNRTARTGTYCWAVVMLLAGWYCGHVVTNNRQNYGDPPKLLALVDGADP